MISVYYDPLNKLVKGHVCVCVFDSYFILFHLYYRLLNTWAESFGPLVHMSVIQSVSQAVDLPIRQTDRQAVSESVREVCVPSNQA